MANIQKVLLPALASLILLPAHAGNKDKNNDKDFRCEEPSIATTTTYYTPTAKKICGKKYNPYKPCAYFIAVAKTQGSGLLREGTLYNYKHETVKMDNCDTTIGKGGCLTPYLSVAADLDIYEIGDIIEVPALKGKVINLGNGKTMVHPGYFVVEDRGAESFINGPNRFDVYTGFFSDKDPENSFGSEAPPELRMVGMQECKEHKRFSVIKPESPQYKESQMAINQSLHNAGEKPRFAVSGSSSEGSSSQNYGAR